MSRNNYSAYSGVNKRKNIMYNIAKVSRNNYSAYSGVNMQVLFQHAKVYNVSK